MQLHQAARFGGPPWNPAARSLPGQPRVRPRPSGRMPATRPIRARWPRALRLAGAGIAACHVVVTLTGALRGAIRKRPRNIPLRRATAEDPRGIEQRFDNCCIGRGV
jgi:hypothetical protein